MEVLDYKGLLLYHSLLKLYISDECVMRISKDISNNLILVGVDNGLYIPYNTFKKYISDNINEIFKNYEFPLLTNIYVNENIDSNNNFNNDLEYYLNESINDYDYIDIYGITDDGFSLYTKIIRPSVGETFTLYNEFHNGTNIFFKARTFLFSDDKTIISVSKAWEPYDYMAGLYYTNGSTKNFAGVSNPVSSSVEPFRITITRIDGIKTKIEDIEIEDEYKDSTYVIKGKMTLNYTLLFNINNTYTINIPPDNNLNILYIFPNNVTITSIINTNNKPYVKEFDLSNFDTTNITTMSYMFYDWYNMTNLDMSNCNTENVTDMSYMCGRCSSLLNIDFIKNFNFKNCTSVSYIFYMCYGLRNIDLSNINFGTVTDMSYMFSNCTNLLTIKLDNINVLNDINMSHMFYGCSNLLNVTITPDIVLSDITYAFGNIGDLLDLDFINFNLCDNCKVHYMFYRSTFTTFNLKNLDLSKCTDMSGMFCYCTNLLNITFENINTSNITDMSYMFSNCTNLITFNMNILDVTAVKNMSFMFNESGILTINFTNCTLNLLNNMSFMFYKCKKLTTINFYKLILNANNISLDYMFDNCTSLKTIDLSFLNSNIYNVYGMFYNCYNLLSVTNIPIINVLKLLMSYMFYVCAALKTIDLSNIIITNNDNINMDYIFSECTNLETIKIFSLSSLNTKNTYYTALFYKCSSLKTIDLSNWTLSNYSLYDIFAGCNNLISVKLWNIHAVSIGYMFIECTLLLTITCPNNTLIISSAADCIFCHCNNLEYIPTVSGQSSQLRLSVRSLYYGCTKLKSVNLTYVNIDDNEIEDMFYNCQSLTTITGDIKIIDKSVGGITQNLSFSPLNNASIMLIINALPTKSKGNILKIHPTTYNTLTTSQIAIATSKNWSIVKS